MDSKLYEKEDLPALAGTIEEELLDSPSREVLAHIARFHPFGIHIDGTPGTLLAELRKRWPFEKGYERDSEALLQHVEGYLRPFLEHLEEMHMTGNVRLVVNVSVDPETKIPFPNSPAVYAVIDAAHGTARHAIILPNDIPLDPKIGIVSYGLTLLCQPFEQGWEQMPQNFNQGGDLYVLTRTEQNEWEKWRVDHNKRWASHPPAPTNMHAAPEGSTDEQILSIAEGFTETQAEGDEVQQRGRDAQEERAHHGRLAQAERAALAAEAATLVAEGTTKHLERQNEERSTADERRLQLRELRERQQLEVERQEDLKRRGETAIEVRERAEGPAELAALEQEGGRETISRGEIETVPLAERPQVEQGREPTREPVESADTTERMTGERTGSPEAAVAEGAATLAGVEAAGQPEIGPSETQREDAQVRLEEVVRASEQQAEARAQVELPEAAEAPEALGLAEASGAPEAAGAAEPAVAGGTPEAAGAAEPAGAGGVPETAGATEPAEAGRVPEAAGAAEPTETAGAPEAGRREEAAGTQETQTRQEEARVEGERQQREQRETADRTQEDLKRRDEVRRQGEERDQERSTEARRGDVEAEGGRIEQARTEQEQRVNVAQDREHETQEQAEDVRHRTEDQERQTRDQDRRVDNQREERQRETQEHDRDEDDRRRDEQRRDERRRPDEQESPSQTENVVAADQEPTNPPPEHALAGQHHIAHDLDTLHEAVEHAREIHAMGPQHMQAATHAAGSAHTAQHMQEISDAAREETEYVAISAAAHHHAAAAHVAAAPPSPPAHPIPTDSTEPVQQHADIAHQMENIGHAAQHYSQTLPGVAAATVAAGRNTPTPPARSSSDVARGGSVRRVVAATPAVSAPPFAPLEQSDKLRSAPAKKAAAPARQTKEKQTLQRTRRRRASARATETENPPAEKPTKNIVASLVTKTPVAKKPAATTRQAPVARTQPAEAKRPTPRQAKIMDKPKRPREMAPDEGELEPEPE